MSFQLLLRPGSSQFVDDAVRIRQKLYSKSPDQASQLGLFRTLYIAAQMSPKQRWLDDGIMHGKNLMAQGMESLRPDLAQLTQAVNYRHRPMM